MTRGRSGVALFLLALGAVLAAVVMPAGAQTSTVPPRVLITAVTPPCAPLNQSVRITVRGTSAVGGGGVIRLTDPGGTQLDARDWADSQDNKTDGNWLVTLIAFTPTVNGYYQILIDEGISNTTDTALFSAPCRNPRLALDPPCFTAGQPVQLTVSGFDFAPGPTGGRAYAYYDYNNANSYGDSRIRIVTDTAGNWATSVAYKSSPFSVTPANRNYPMHANDLSGNAIDTVWAPCPPPTTAPSTTVPEETTVPEITVTTRPGQTTTIPLITTTSTTIPPATPGATLTVSPPLGRGGAVVMATGTGFAPGAVSLTWAPGLGVTDAVVGADGTFQTRVFVFPHDRLGSRTLVATGFGGRTASTPFLVVPNTVKPSGTDVTQINRIRRFLQR